MRRRRTSRRRSSMRSCEEEMEDSTTTYSPFPFPSYPFPSLPASTFDSLLRPLQPPSSFPDSTHATHTCSSFPSPLPLLPLLSRHIPFSPPLLSLRCSFVHTLSPSLPCKRPSPSPPHRRRRFRRLSTRPTLFSPPFSLWLIELASLCTAGFLIAEGCAFSSCDRRSTKSGGLRVVRMGW